MPADLSDNAWQLINDPDIRKHILLDPLLRTCSPSLPTVKVQSFINTGHEFLPWKCHAVLLSGLIPGRRTERCKNWKSSENKSTDLSMQKLRTFLTHTWAASRNRPERPWMERPGDQKTSARIINQGVGSLNLYVTQLGGGDKDRVHVAKLQISFQEFLPKQCLQLGGLPLGPYLFSWRSEAKNKQNWTQKWGGFLFFANLVDATNSETGQKGDTQNF